MDLKSKRPFGRKILIEDFKKLNDVRKVAEKNNLTWRYVYGRLYYYGLIKVNHKRKSFVNPFYIGKRLLEQSGLKNKNKLNTKFIPGNKKLIIEITEKSI